MIKKPLVCQLQLALVLATGHDGWRFKEATLYYIEKLEGNGIALPGEEPLNETKRLTKL